MPINWWAALRAVPWGTILSRAPSVVDAANRLLSESRRKRAPPGSDELDMLTARVAALEEHDQADAAVTKQLADEIATLANAAQIVAARIRIALFASILALVIAIISLGVALSS